MARSTSETESGISSSFMRIGVMPPSCVLVRAMIPRAGVQRTVNAARSTDAGPDDVQQPLDGVGPFAGPQPLERAVEQERGQPVDSGPGGESGGASLGRGQDTHGRELVDTPLEQLERTESAATAGVRRRGV